MAAFLRLSTFRSQATVAETLGHVHVLSLSRAVSLSRGLSLSQSLSLAVSLSRARGLSLSGARSLPKCSGGSFKVRARSFLQIRLEKTSLSKLEFVRASGPRAETSSLHSTLTASCSADEGVG
jgi:hypothetical protein